MHSVWIGRLLLWSITLLLHSQCHGASVNCLQPTNSSGHFKQPSPVLNCSGQHKTSNTNCKCNGETLLLCSCASNGETYYVRPPNSTTPCPSEPCHVLSYYAQHNTFNTSNARFVFLPGNHTLNTTIVVENVQNLTLTGDDRFKTGLLGLPAPSSQIHCNRINGTGFLFLELSNLSVQNLLLSKCSHNFIDKLLYWYYSALTLRNVNNVSIYRVNMQHNPGNGILAMNVIGRIIDSNILFSKQLFVLFGYHHGYHCHDYAGDTFSVKSSRFLYGYGLALVVNNSCPTIELSFEDITVVGTFGVALYINNYGWNLPATSSIIVSDSSFRFGQVKDTLSMVTVFLYHVKNVTFSNCVFEDNIGTAIAADNSVITFKGNVIFRNNTGVNGGVLQFSDSSIVKLDKQTSVSFINNHAQYFGGAIYIGGTESILPNTLCFFQVPLTSEGHEIHLHFENNTAIYGGTVVYGSSIDTNIMTNGLSCAFFFDTLFNLTNTGLDPSVVSSDPIGVCFCTNDIPAECSNKTNRKRSVTVYPGQTFNVSAITVGQRGGTVTGVIYAHVEHGNATVDSMQELQAVDSYDDCKSLSYTVFTSAKLVTLSLTAVRATNTPVTTKWRAKVHVTFHKCPVGFHLSSNTTQPKCDCVPILKKHHISCNINEETIHRPASSWIGYYNASYDNETSGVLYCAHCPLDYCEHTDT